LSIKALKDSLKGQHELVEHVKSSLLQLLEALNMLDVRDGEEIVLDETEVVA
jgi:DNA-binding protein Fis